MKHGCHKSHGDRRIAGFLRKDQVAAIAPRTDAIRSLVAGQVVKLFDESRIGGARTHRRIVFHESVRERLRDKLWPFVAIPLAIVRPNELDRAVVALSASLSWLYDVIRVIRLVGTYGFRHRQSRLGKVM